MKQLKIRIPDRVYEQLQAQADVATDGNVAELVRMMLVASTVGIPQVPGTDQGLSGTKSVPIGAQMVPDGTELVPDKKGNVESAGTNRAPIGPKSGPNGTESVPPADKPSKPCGTKSVPNGTNRAPNGPQMVPPASPSSPPSVFSQSADADCVASGDMANGRMVEVSRQNGDEDPTVRSKAVQIYRHFFGRYPTRDKRRIIADAVPETELSAWRETLEEWKSEGWSVTNVEGMIDRFKRRLEAETVELQDRAGSARSVKPSRSPIPYHEALGLWEKRSQPGGKFPPDGWTMVTGPDGKAWFIVP